MNKITKELGRMKRRDRSLCVYVHCFQLCDDLVLLGLLLDILKSELPGLIGLFACLTVVSELPTA